MASMAAEVSAATAPRVPRPLDAGAVAVRAEGLVMEYGSAAALRGVGLAVAAGEAVAVVGPSGSGKSTLLHCLAGLVRPTRGTVEAAGTDLGSLGPEALARHRRQYFGFVFQSGLLVADLPLVENVALPLLLDGVARSEALERARRGLEELGVGDLARRRPGQVSGGEAQRVAVARALVNGPAVVFADEPTGALDSANARHVVDVVLAGVGRTGSALVLVTHDMDVARRLDRIVPLRDGVIDQRGPSG